MFDFERVNLNEIGSEEVAQCKQFCVDIFGYGFNRMRQERRNSLIKAAYVVRAARRLGIQIH